MDALRGLCLLPAWVLELHVLSQVWPVQHRAEQGCCFLALDPVPVAALEPSPVPWDGLNSLTSLLEASKQNPKAFHQVDVKSSILPVWARSGCWDPNRRLDLLLLLGFLFASFSRSSEFYYLSDQLSVPSTLHYL